MLPFVLSMCVFSDLSRWCVGLHDLSAHLPHLDDLQALADSGGLTAGCLCLLGSPVRAKERRWTC